MFLCGGPRNAENNGAQKNLNVAILVPLYHAPGMGHRTHPENEFQRENLCVNGVLLIWIRRYQMKYLPLAKELVGQGPCQIKLYYSSLYCRITHCISHRASSKRHPQVSELAT